MQFREVIGHETIKKQLIQTVSENRVSHAQLFAGSEGAGALPMALAFAQYMQCQNPGPDDSCGVCPACHKKHATYSSRCSFCFFRL